MDNKLYYRQKCPAGFDNSLCISNSSIQFPRCNILDNIPNMIDSSTNINNTCFDSVTLDLKNANKETIQLCCEECPSNLVKEGLFCVDTSENKTFVKEYY